MANIYDKVEIADELVGQRSYRGLSIYRPFHEELSDFIDDINYYRRKSGLPKIKKGMLVHLILEEGMSNYRNAYFPKN